MGQICDMGTISERTAAVEDRAVPGHRDGDLIMDKHKTATRTLAERWSCFVTFILLPDSHGADAVLVVREATVERWPEHLCESLTRDQGEEMARECQVFCVGGAGLVTLPPFCSVRVPGSRGTWLGK